MDPVFLKFAQFLTGQPPKSAEEIGRFLDIFRSKGIDINHPFLRHFRPDDHRSIAGFKKMIENTGDKDIAEKVFVEYAKEYLRANPLCWDTVFNYIRVGEAFMEEPENSQMWYSGFFMKQRALEFMEQNKKNCPEDRYQCDNIYETLQKRGILSPKMTLPEKIGPRIKERGLRYTLGAIWRNAADEAKAAVLPKGLEGVPGAYLTGHITTREQKGALPGFKILDTELNGRKLGTMIIGDPKEGARARLAVNVGGAVTGEELEKEHGQCLQYHGTLSMQSQEGSMPLGTVMVDGVPKQMRFEAGRQDGLVVTFPDGRMTILDKRAMFLSDITGDEKDSSVSLSITEGTDNAKGQLIDVLRERKATLLSAASFDPSARFERWNQINGDSQIRLIFSFEDGKFGVFDTPNLSTNEMLAILYRMQEQYGRLLRVVRCDRGMWDDAAYYLHGKRKVILASIGANPANRMVFYSDKGCK